MSCRERIVVLSRRKEQQQKRPTTTTTTNQKKNKRKTLTDGSFIVVVVFFFVFTMAPRINFLGGVNAFGVARPSKVATRTTTPLATTVRTNRNNEDSITALSGMSRIRYSREQFSLFGSFQNETSPSGTALSAGVGTPNPLPVTTSGPTSKGRNGEGILPSTHPLESGVPTDVYVERVARAAEMDDRATIEQAVAALKNGTVDYALVSADNTSAKLTPLEESQGTVSVLSIDPVLVDIYERNTTQVDQLEECPIVNVGDMFGNRHFVDMFRGSANYIASHRNTLVVYHIPGDLLEEDPAVFRDLMNDISLTWLLGMKIVIVAGCRYQIEKRIKNRETHMGMAVTDPESLRIVKEEAGYVRFEVERQLARALKGAKGGGMEGNVVSGNFYSSQPCGVLDGVDYMYSGFVRKLETEKIHSVHKNRDIVLLTALGFSPTGEVFNVNSEYLAAYAGGALGASKVIYFLEKDAALRHKIHGSNIPHLRVNDGKRLLALNGVRTETKGFVYVDNCPYEGARQSMLIKMGWGMIALEAGVKRVHLVAPENGMLLQELYTRDGGGTMISGDLYDGILKARVEDVNAIYELITPLVEKGTLIERTKSDLERNIDQYHIYTRDGLVVACGQLKIFENGYAEIGCMVVNPAYRAKGRGDAMLGYLERLAVQAGATILFVLSTQTMEWFIERGFDLVGVNALPPSRQATYNHVRASKIYMKKVTSVRELDANELFWDR